MSISLALPVPVSMMFEGSTSPCAIPSRYRTDRADRPSRCTAMAISGWSAPAVMITPLR
jgi:hypothetical protein